MGKSASGAVWLDADMLSPYDFYQYWINCDDLDVEKFLKLFTLLPMEEIRRLGALQGSDVRQAKRALAFEATRLSHGKDAAKQAQAASAAAFGAGGDLDAMPTTVISAERLAAGISPAELFAEVGLTRSRGEARRLFKQGGMYVNDERVESLEQTLTEADLSPDGMLLRAGKKKYHRLLVE